MGPRGRGGVARPSASPSSATRPRSSRPGRRRASGSTSSRTRPRPTTRSAATCRPRSASPTRSSCAARLPEEYQRRSRARDGRPRPRDARVPARRRGRVRLRQQPARPGQEAGVDRRLRLPGLRARVHPAAVLRGPRPVPLGRAVGRPGRHPRARTGRSSSCSPTTPACAAGSRWPRRACRSRACRPGSAGSATASGPRPASRSTSWSGPARSRRPIVIGRDHLDAGSVASPNRETEAMLDGSDAVADWPLLNALVNTAAGATWVSIHHGGGVGHRLQPARRDGRRRRRHGARGPEAGARPHDGPGDGRPAPRRRGLRARDRGRPGARRPRPDARPTVSDPADRSG